MRVVWWDAGRGNWDHGLLMEVFNYHPELFDQHNSKELIYPDEAIVIVTGKPEVEPLRAWLDKLSSGLVILTSDEDSYFDWKAAIPKHLDLWTSYYSQNKSEIKERLLLGPPSRISEYKINKPKKKYLWSFIGQMQNPFRDKCINLLKGLIESKGELSNGFLHRAPMFGGQVDGIEYQKYLDITAASKYVICPAGSMCVDSFRFYEAMECGAIPITDRRAPRDHPDFNYWREVLGPNTIITVGDWDELPDILKHQYEGSGSFWWTQYKRDFEHKLLRYAMD